MAKQSGLAKRLQIMQAKRDQEVRRHARIFQLDMVTLALGRMGWRESKLREFDRVLAEVAEEYCKDIVEDAKEDAELWYSKDTLDRELKQYCGSMFVPYDERYGGVVE